MTQIVFIDHVFRLFAEAQWQSGLSLFHAGACRSVDCYQDLVSGKVFCGLGEEYTVRIKLHGHGRCVQWMECNCSVNRRKGQACAHLAALSMYLDQEAVDILEAIGLAHGRLDVSSLPPPPIIAPQAKAKAKENQNYLAKRFFRVHKKEGALEITRCVAITDKKAKETILALNDHGSLSVMHEYIDHPKYGRIMCNDGMGVDQFHLWNQFPTYGVLSGDLAASMIEQNFQRLRDTAEVQLDRAIHGLSCFALPPVENMKVTETREGLMRIDAQLEGSVSLWDILKARALGKEYLSTQKGWFKLSQDFDWLQEKVNKKGELILSTMDVIRFKEQLADQAKVEDKTKHFGSFLQGLGNVETMGSPALHREFTLRPYQTIGLNWLHWIHQNHLGGLLADEMGLGKTHQAMALLSALSVHNPKGIALVVCPTSVVDHWEDKMIQYLSEFLLVRYHGPQRDLKEAQGRSAYAVLITSYGILLRDIEHLKQIPFDTVILDEAHLVKNQLSRTYNAACQLQSQSRFCLTGTPMENDLMELKNLYDFILPQYLGSDKEFRKRYLTTPAQKSGEQELVKLMRPFRLRRTKQEVLHDLPSKVEDIKHCQLTQNQMDLYMEALALRGKPLISLLEDQKSGPIPFLHVFSLISLLKQICNDPSLIHPRYEGMTSGKLILFDELLEECLASGLKVVVFSQYARMIQRLSRRLQSKDVGHVVLTGQTTNRRQAVEAFQTQDNVKVFLGSLLAGGTGIDLTAASVVIHFDRWWNAAKEDQATDRVHRIGQSRSVMVYKLVTRGTLEERIHTIINRKKDLFQRVLDNDDRVMRHLTREDLRDILAAPETPVFGEKTP